MAESLAPVDAESFAVAQLRAGMTARGDTATVATKVPTTRPSRMVRVSLADTYTVTLAHFGSALLVECWAPTEAAAGLLARRAYGILRALADHDQVVGFEEVGGIVNFADETGPRYQSTISLLMNGEIV